MKELECLLAALRTLVCFISIRFFVSNNDNVLLTPIVHSDVRILLKLYTKANFRMGHKSPFIRFSQIYERLSFKSFFRPQQTDSLIMLLFSVIYRIKYLRLGVRQG